ncbi:hypothetical protein [Alicyclobacillus acidoterrestris]|uniref:Uncharacterized protein n=1 Tax=Alicyclobacillus acidoterrestris (strain ATCC 49025 / DSM 3922 / CIP 106132 / NCIMB 13137 / GD3B) TaxID=1356854 RepID=T0DDH5_ALIAG|nr:hypothetical protein [Alicyclobacillus acidoterrestris]EPZ47711.1 hypothetical protein N007_05505 [Alicyclobacillus acidoterrestris ATCC 49025]UNO47976.1 hypothetical protein K1I37_14980 [Alicyclobacillus acidoterrestris]
MTKFNIKYPSDFTNCNHLWDVDDEIINHEIQWCLRNMNRFPDQLSWTSRIGNTIVLVIRFNKPDGDDYGVLVTKDYAVASVDCNGHLTKGWELQNWEHRRVEE